MNLSGASVIVTGGGGFLGRYIVDKLHFRGAHPYIVRSSQYDLRVQSDVEKLFKAVKADAVLHLAAKVGGIGANQKHPGSFYYENLIMGTLLMEQARQANIQKFVGVSSVCAYPKDLEVPAKECSLWDGYPEETNAGYGFGKKMLVVQSQMYRDEYSFNAITLMMVNLYGPGDNFDPQTSHVIPALIARFIRAREQGLAEVIVWGSGRVTRDFLYVEDAAEGIIRAAELYDGREPINLASGREISISDLAEKIARACGYAGKIVWDSTKPDGQPRRLFDISRAREQFSFEPSTGFDDGLTRTVEWFLKERPDLRKIS